jgi:hypothetical protein
MESGWPAGFGGSPLTSMPSSGVGSSGFRDRTAIEIVGRWATEVMMRIGADRRIEPSLSHLGRFG